MTDPEFSFGKGWGHIALRGKEAIHQGGWAIRALLLARGLAIVVIPILTLLLTYWRFG